jgi:hypothetical protein
MKIKGCIMYPHIEAAIQQLPDFEQYITLIKERSLDASEDLLSIEYILTYHTAEQAYNFMPRFISLISINPLT